MNRHIAWAALSISLVGSITANLTAAPPQPLQPLSIGAQAPDFDLPGADGRRYSLKDFADARFLAVLFTCNHCPTAQVYEERFKRLVDDYRGKGVAFVAISPNDPKAVRLDELGYTDLNDSLEEMTIRAEHRKFNFPYLYDGETQEVSRAYGPVVTPHLFIFDGQRKLQFVGRIDDSEVEKRVTKRDARAALAALVAGRPVPAPKTKTFGCSVKWSDKRAANVQFMKRLAAEPVAVETVDVKGIKALLAGDPNKFRLINVWATWCGPCVVEFPEFVTINRMYRHRDFELVTISADDPKRKTKVLSMLKKWQASNRNLLFDSTDTYKLIEALDPKWEGGLPYTMLIRPGGEVVFRHQGAIDPLALRRRIVSLLGPFKE